MYRSTLINYSVVKKLTYHNFIQITQRTKLRIAPVALVVSSLSNVSRSSCRVCRTVLFDKLDTAKMHAWVRHVERVESYRVTT